MPTFNTNSLSTFGKNHGKHRPAMLLNDLKVKSLNLSSNPKTKNFRTTRASLDINSVDQVIQMEALDLLQGGRSKALGATTTRGQHRESTYQMRDGLAQLIEEKTSRIEERLTSRASKADRMYSKFLIRQRDKSPPSPARMAEQMSLMNSSQPSFMPHQRQPTSKKATKVNFHESIDFETQQSQIQIKMGTTGNGNQYNSSYHVNAKMATTAKGFQQRKVDKNNLTVNHLTTMSSTDTISRQPTGTGTMANSTRVSKMQKGNTKLPLSLDTAAMGRQQTIQINNNSNNVRRGSSKVMTTKTLHVGHILANHNNAFKAESSVSKISLLANKLDKIKMYNQEARVVQKKEQASFYGHIMDQYEPIFEKDRSTMMGVPRELCAPNIQQKFIVAKRNMISRGVQNMIERRTLYEWQLPQLKPKVLKLRESSGGKRRGGRNIEQQSQFLTTQPISVTDRGVNNMMDTTN